MLKEIYLCFFLDKSKVKTKSLVNKKKKINKLKKKKKKRKKKKKKVICFLSFFQRNASPYQRVTLRNEFWNICRLAVISTASRRETLKCGLSNTESVVLSTEWPALLADYANIFLQENSALSPPPIFIIKSLAWKCKNVHSSILIDSSHHYCSCKSSPTTDVWAELYLYHQCWVVVEVGPQKWIPHLSEDFLLKLSC